MEIERIVNNENSKIPWLWLILGIFVIAGIVTIIILATRKSPEKPNVGKKQTVIQSYLELVYPTSDKIKNMTATEAENWYNQLWFYFLVLDYMGTPSSTTSKTGENITIPGTLTNISNLMPVEYQDGAPFFHPNSIAIKNTQKVFYNNAGKSMTNPDVALKAVSNGKYIEVTSFGWNPYPNGIYLNSAIGSGIFWNPGVIIVGYNKLEVLYKTSCQINNVKYISGKYSSAGYTALQTALKKYDKSGAVMKELKKLQQVSGKMSIEDIVKAHVEDNRQYLSQSQIVKSEAVSAYDNPMQQIGLAAKYDSCMLIAQANGDGSFDIEFCDFRVVINGSFGSGIIDDDITSKWEIFSSKYLSVRDPFDINNESKVLSINIEFPKIMFSGEDAKYHCKASTNCGPTINNNSKNVNEYCSLMGCQLADTPQSWKNGQTIQPYKSKNTIQIFTPGGVMFAINDSKRGLSMIKKSITTSKILEHNANINLIPRLSDSVIDQLLNSTDLNVYNKILNMSTPTDSLSGLRNYFKITYPLSSLFWDKLDNNDLVHLYLQINSHYMPLILPIGKMTYPTCSEPNECILPPSKNSRTQFWAFDGVHLEGAAGSDIGQAANSTKNYPDSAPYAYQTVGNPFDGGAHAIFDRKTMTLTEGGYPNYAWVESVQYADESGGEKLRGKWDTSSQTVVGPESCTCNPDSSCNTFVSTPGDVIENYDERIVRPKLTDSGDVPCDSTCTEEKVVPCSIGKTCSGKGCQSYCNIPDAFENCAITFNGDTPPSDSICGFMDFKSQKWKQGKCSNTDACKWSTDGKTKPTPQNLFDCIDNPTDKSNCSVPWSISYNDQANTVHIPVTTTMYYPQQGYGKFTNYGKTGIYYSNVSLLLTLPDLNLRMSMEQIIQLVGKSVGGLSIYHQLQALLSTKTRDPRKYLTGYVVLPNTEFNKLSSSSKSKIFKINNQRSVKCENPLINPADDPRLKSILTNFTAFYAPPEESIFNPQYQKTYSYNYETAIQLLMAMYIHGCTGNHSQKYNYPFGSYNSYGMTIGHLAYVRTKAMGWNTVQLARDPDYSGDSMKYCEWPFYDYEIIHVAADPPTWFNPSMAQSNPKYPNETDGYGFDLSVGGVWSGSSAPKSYVFCRGMFTLDITKFLGFYVAHGYIPGSGNWEDDMKLLNLRPINRNIFKQGQLVTDSYAQSVRSYYTPTTWGDSLIIYDQTCPFPEWRGNTCAVSDPTCVVTKKGEGIYYQAMHSTNPVGTWPTNP
jgi:hypothetical protein